MRTFGDLTIGDIIYNVNWSIKNKPEVKPYQIVYIGNTLEFYDGCKDYVEAFIVDIFDFNIRRGIMFPINQSELSSTFRRWFVDDKECFDFYDSISNCKTKR